MIRKLINWYLFRTGYRAMCYNCNHIQGINWDDCKKCGYTTISDDEGLHDIRIKGDWNNLK